MEYKPHYLLFCMFWNLSQQGKRIKPFSQMHVKNQLISESGGGIGWKRQSYDA